jgi:hypothetical protein
MKPIVSAQILSLDDDASTTCYNPGAVGQSIKSFESTNPLSSWLAVEHDYQETPASECYAPVELHSMLIDRHSKLAPQSGGFENMNSVVFDPNIFI